MESLSGIICALCTPMNDVDGSIDMKGLERHIDRMLQAGMDGILVCGGTGEFAMLRTEERRRIAEVAARRIDGRARFLIHVSAVNTDETIEFAQHARDCGADAMLVLPPYFEGPDAEGVYRHFERVAEAVPLPIMVYNIPVHAGFDVTPEFFARLRQIETVRYIKDSTSDLIRVQDLLASGAAVFNGGDPIAAYALMAGCPGCVWGGANAMPEQAVQLYKLVTAGDLGAALALWQRMFPANRFFWNPVYNARVKAAANLAGSDIGPCRSPVMPLTEAEVAELHNAMAALAAA